MAGWLAGWLAGCMHKIEIISGLLGSQDLSNDTFISSKETTLYSFGRKLVASAFSFLSRGTDRLDDDDDDDEKNWYKGDNRLLFRVGIW